jgi:hypothetical protein
VEVTQSVGDILSLQDSIHVLFPEEQEKGVPEVEEDSPIFGSS